MAQVGLSKSKYAAYCQCPKLLWLSQYRSNEATPDPQAESRMEIGIQVGELARNYFEGTVSAIELYPDGSQDRTAMLKRTQQLIDAQTPVIAEAAFSYDGNYCAVDLLRYTPEGWIIYEVKSTTADSSEDEAEDKRNYYAKAMQGSYSIKYVLPALFPNDSELDYHSLEDVHNGGEAMTIFPKIQFMEPKEQARVRANLLKYCCLDTYAMVKVLGKLYMSCGLPKSQSTSCK